MAKDKSALVCAQTDSAQGTRAVFRLKEHIKRLDYSARGLGMKLPYSESDLVQATLKTVEASPFKSGYIRPISFWGEGGLGLSSQNNQVDTAIIVLPWKDYLAKTGISLKIVSRRRISPLAFDMRAKWGGVYINSILAHAEAKKTGFDEALLLDDQGFLAEGAGENIFFVKGGRIITPAEGNILPGITRQSVMTLAKQKGYSIQERKIKPEEISKFDECFLTGTAAEVTPVSRLSDHTFGQPGPVTLELAELYRAVTAGEVKKFNRWLSPVK